MDDSTAVCHLCNSDISRGRNLSRRYSTSPLYAHLRSCHGRELARAEKERELAAAATKKAEGQPGTGTSRDSKRKRCETMTLEQVIAKKQAWKPDHPSAEAATKCLAEMIAVDLQPYAIVEDEGFRRYSNHLEPRYSLPSRRLLSEQIMPGIYEKVKDRLQSSLRKAKRISFTTDIWTEPCTTKAFIGISAHWIDANWERKFAIISCEEFSGRHTSKRIAGKLESILDGWGIKKAACHVVMCDNAANMAKAFQEAGIPIVGCALHTLQLAIHDCIFDQRAVSGGLASCRRLVGHFKHSSAASHRLAELQKELHCEFLRPVQDVSTR